MALKVFSGTSNKSLAEKVAKSLSLELSPLQITVFPDGEKRVRVIDAVVDVDTVVVQSAANPPDQNYMELFFIIDALKRSGARSVTCVVPYLGYQRQDHIFRDGEAVSLDVIIKTLEGVGASRVITFDLHSIKIPELFKIPVSHLSALPLFAGEIKDIIARGPVSSAGPAAHQPHAFPTRLTRRGPPHGAPRLASPADINNFVLVSPDLGGVRRIKLLSEMLADAPYAVIEKDRDLETGSVVAKKIEGEILETAIVVDDMISTGKTIASAVSLLKEKGVKNIFVFATHPVFSQNAKKTLEDFDLKVFVTDTIEIPKDKQFPNLEILSVADIIAEEVRATSH